MISMCVCVVNARERRVQIHAYTLSHAARAAARGAVCRVSSDVARAQRETERLRDSVHILGSCVHRV